MFTPFREDKSIDFDGIDALVDYYLQENAAGLFPVCTSGEFLHLYDDEPLQIARRVVERTNGKASVVATGNFGKTLDQQIETIKRMADTGIQVTIIATSLLPDLENMERDILTIVEKTNIPLGIYEAPIPVHTTLPPEFYSQLAKTHRFYFCKETSKSHQINQQKIDAVKGYDFKIFQANLNAHFDGGTNFSSGFCGCIANTATKLMDHYIKGLTDPPKKEYIEIKNIILKMEEILQNNLYPASAKYYLNRIGLPIKPICRADYAQGFSNVHIQNIEHYLCSTIKDSFEL